MTNRIFSLLCVVISVWLAVMNISVQPQAPAIGLWLIRLSIFLATPMNMLFFLLADTLPNDRMRMGKKTLSLLLITNFLIMVIAISPLAFTDIQIVNNSPVPTPGFGLIPFGIFALFTSVGAVLVLFKRMAKAVSLEKQQLRLITIGILCMYSLIIGTIFLPVALFQINMFVSFAPLYVLIFLLLTAYTIVRHRFLDIHIIIVRSVAYFLILVIFVVLYAVGLFFIARFITQESLQIYNIIPSAIYALILFFSLQPLRRLLEKMTANVLYKQMYSSQTLLWNTSRIMASTFMLSEISESLLTEIIKHMNISHGSMVLIRDSSIIWAKQIGALESPEYNEQEISNLLHRIVKTSTEHILVFDEMYESDEKKVMRDHNISVLMALIVEDKVIGGILLSEKSSGDIYSSEDIGILKILSPEISVAVKNSLSYEEINGFNTTLQTEIQKATDEVKRSNQAMYMQNLQLAESNKTLSLLRKMDDAILSAVNDPQSAAQQVSDIIVDDTNFQSLVIVFTDTTNNAVSHLATAPSSIMDQIKKNFQKDLKGITISLADPHNLLVQVVTKKTVQHTDSFADIFGPHLNDAEAKKLQELVGVVCHVVCPLIVRGQVIGAMAFGLSERYENLSDYQKDLIMRLVGIMGIALDNGVLYQKIEEANERLKQLDELKDEFVSVASHELRTPMTAIKSYLWLALAGKGGPLSDKLRFYLDRSYTSTNRLIKLVNDMLNVSRIESGRMSFEMKKLNVVRLTEDVLAEVKPRADELGVEIIITYEKLDIPDVVGDDDKMKEVLINLIGNSLKFTPKGGKITVSFSVKEPMVITHVTDTGEGIAQEDLPKLFQKFSLVRGSYQTNKQSSQGTGLGLYISKMIMKEHGGDIWAESPGRGRGATFSFSMKMLSEVSIGTLTAAVKKDGLRIIHSEV